MVELDAMMRRLHVSFTTRKLPNPLELILMTVPYTVVHTRWQLKQRTPVGKVQYLHDIWESISTQP